MSSCISCVHILPVHLTYLYVIGKGPGGCSENEEEYGEGGCEEDCQEVSHPPRPPPPSPPPRPSRYLLRSRLSVGFYHVPPPRHFIFVPHSIAPPYIFPEPLVIHIF